VTHTRPFMTTLRVKGDKPGHDRLRRRGCTVGCFVCPVSDALHPPDLSPQVFRNLDFTLLEMNPFTLDSAGRPFPLDMRGELDDTAAFKSGKKWGPVEFPLPFGRSMTSAEERILAMDENTGARAAASGLHCCSGSAHRQDRDEAH